MTKKTPPTPRPLEITSLELLKEKPLCPMSGSRHPDVQQVMSNQVISTLWLAHSNEEEKRVKMHAALAMAVGIKPQDEIEGMLAAQMIAAYSASMECFRRAMLSEQTFEGRNASLSQANKLTRSYAMMMEALNRYRGKGQQVMRVEHVTVNAGGQAIVGNVTQKAGGGVNQKNEEQPHAK